jgi:hypothetical protein
MRHISSTPSLAPNTSSTVYIVVDDFGNLGASYRETAVEDGDRPTVIDDLLAGQFHNPLRVVAFNTAEGWSADASEDIARAVVERALAEGEPLPLKVRGFCERHIGQDLPAALTMSGQ